LSSALETGREDGDTRFPSKSSLLRGRLVLRGGSKEIVELAKGRKKIGRQAIAESLVEVVIQVNLARKGEKNKKTNCAMVKLERCLKVWRTDY